MSLNYNLQIGDDDFINRRHWILGETYFIYRLVRFLRSELGIPIDGFKNETEALEWSEKKKFIDYSIFTDKFTKKEFGNKSIKRLLSEERVTLDKGEKNFFMPLYNAIDRYPHLQLEFKFLKLLVLGSNGNPFIDLTDYIGNAHIYPVWSSKEPITEVGVYIKYSPWLSPSDLEKLKKLADVEYLRLISDKPLLQVQASKEKRKRDDSPDRVGKYYLPIEEKCIDCYINKKPFKINTLFEELAAKLKIKSSIVRNSYYTIQKRFFLPSVTDASNIPVL